MEKGDCGVFPRTKSEWLPEVERQDNELLAWIDEFLASEEYADILQQRVDLQSKQKVKSWNELTQRTRDFKVVQHPEDVGDVVKGREGPAYDNLTVIEKKVRESLHSLKITNTVENQRRGIEVIRNKILEAKQEYDDNLANNAEKLVENKTKALSTLRRNYHITLTRNELTERVMEKVLRLRNAKMSSEASKNKKKAQVVANILRDLKRDSLEKRLRRGGAFKSKKRRKMEALSDIEEIEVDEQSLFEEGQFESEEITSESIKVEEILPKTKLVSLKIDKKQEKTSSTKIEKAAKEKKSIKTSGKSSKTSKQSQKQQPMVEATPIPSYIPNPNTRRKHIPEFVLGELLENITKLYEYLMEKESYEITDGFANDILLPIDDGFFGRPNKIIFKDFQPGKRYKKTISIVNGNRDPRKIRLDRIVWNADIDEDNLLEVEAMGVERLLPGTSFKLSLRFAPEVLNKTADGRIVFLTNKLRNDRFKQFALSVVCLPLCAAVLITPTVISFEETPIWRARAMAKQGKNYKTIKISNSGLKECKVVVTKSFNNQTMEQEWKKIISIIKIDENSEGERRQLSSSNLENPSDADPFPRNLVQQCVENVFNAFRFERNVFSVSPKSSVVMKCWWKDVSEVGYQVESYNFSIYERFLDGQLYCIGTQDVIVNSETNSHFLTSNVEILDFEVCVYDSVYQLDFELTNPCKQAHHIQICFPSRMKSYLQSNPAVAAILANQTIKINLKFMPTVGILYDNKFYDAEVELLEFPVYVAVQTKNYEDTPPLRIDVFAAVTESQGVALNVYDKVHSLYENNVEYYDLGMCTTMESVYIDIEVNNTSLVPQQFGFLNLPEFVTITPNSGFGQLKPMQKATIRVLISPSRLDVIDNEGVLKFQLFASTIKNCGAIKKKTGGKDLVAKLKQMEDIVCRSRGSNSSKLKEDIQALKAAVKKKSVSVSLSSTSKSSGSVDRFIQAVEDDEQLINLVKYDIEEEKEISSNMDLSSTLSQSDFYSNCLNFRICVADVAVELSHQIINFPDTPCGSYSCMSIDLIMHKVPGFKYQATFEIWQQKGNGEFVVGGEFEVQPSFGQVASNKKMPVWIVAKPNVPAEVVKQRAASLRRTESEKLKVEDEKEDHEVVSDRKKKEGKDGKASNKTKSVKNKKSKNKEESKPLLEVDLDDSYRAEMDIWRTIDPYNIEGVFVCRVTYQGINTVLHREPEEISFKVSCQVVSPNFIHDQKHQVIDFGPIAIGTSATKIISFQNIQRRNITIDVSPTNPLGPFSSTARPNSQIPPEYIYTYPLKFTPMEEQPEIEFLDVTSDNTSYPFIVKGVGIMPNLVFNPNFTVCRITATRGGFQDCSFDIRNESDVNVSVFLQKTCELEGTLTQPDVFLDGKKLKTSKPPKRSKFSVELYDDEIHSLETSFGARDFGDPSITSLFHVIDNTNVDNTFNIGAHSKCNVKIRFGEVAKVVTNAKNPPTSGKSKDSHSQANRAKTTASSTTDAGRCFIVKYNLLVGTHYVKDLIIIGNIS